MTLGGRHSVAPSDEPLKLKMELDVADCCPKCRGWAGGLGGRVKLFVPGPMAFRLLRPLHHGSWVCPECQQGRSPKNSKMFAPSVIVARGTTVLAEHFLCLQPKLFSLQSDFTSQLCKNCFEMTPQSSRPILCRDIDSGWKFPPAWHRMTRDPRLKIAKTLASQEFLPFAKSYGEIEGSKGVR